MSERRSGQLDCDWTVNENTGCRVAFPGELNFGPSFNDNGGGWHVHASRVPPLSTYNTFVFSSGLL